MRRVRTFEGSRYYGLPMGAPITADDIAKARAKNKGKSAPAGASTRSSAPRSPGAVRAATVTANQAAATAARKRPPTVNFTQPSKPKKGATQVKSGPLSYAVESDSRTFSQSGSPVSYNVDAEGTLRILTPKGEAKVSPEAVSRVKSLLVAERESLDESTVSSVPDRVEDMPGFLSDEEIERRIQAASVDAGSSSLDLLEDRLRRSNEKIRARWERQRDSQDEVTVTEVDDAAPDMGGSQDAIQSRSREGASGVPPVRDAQQGDSRGEGGSAGPLDAGTDRNGPGDGLVISGQRVATLGKLPRSKRSEAIEAEGGSTPELTELDSAQSAGAFRDAIMATKTGRYAAAVFVYEEAEYRDMRLFLTEDGTAGVALKDDEIVSVFNTEGGPHRKVSRHLIASAVEAGGRRLDAFDTVLPELYALEGFEPVARTDFDTKFAPEGWDVETFGAYNEGRPDVVFMVYSEGTLDTPYTPTAGKRVADYDVGYNAAVAAVKDLGGASETTNESSPAPKTDEEIQQSLFGDVNPDYEVRDAAQRESIDRVADELGNTPELIESSWAMRREMGGGPGVSRESAIEAMSDTEFGAALNYWSIDGARVTFYQEGWRPLPTTDNSISVPAGTSRAEVERMVDEHAVRSAVHTLTTAWRGSSTSSEGLAITAAVNRRQSGGADAGERTFADDYVDAVYANTQTALASRGITSVRVYRGLRDTAPGAERADVAVASWTTSKPQADFFARLEGGTVLERNVPASEILSIGGIGPGSQLEREVLVMAPATPSPAAVAAAAQRLDALEQQPVNLDAESTTMNSVSPRQMPDGTLSLITQRQSIMDGTAEETEPLKYIYRAISEEEYNGIKANGFARSDGRMNLAEDEGTVATHRNPSFYLPQGVGVKGRIIRMQYDPADNWRLDSDGYLKTDSQIPVDRIDAVSPMTTGTGTNSLDPESPDFLNSVAFGTVNELTNLMGSARAEIGRRVDPNSEGALNRLSDRIWGEGRGIKTDSTPATISAYVDNIEADLQQIPEFPQKSGMQKVLDGARALFGTSGSNTSSASPQPRNPRSLGEDVVPDEDDLEAMLASPFTREHIGPDGEFTPERQALHDAIIARFLDGVEPAENPMMFMNGGGPASGKGTMTTGENAAITGYPSTHRVDDEGNFIRIDAPTGVIVDPDQLKLSLTEVSEAVGMFREGKEMTEPQLEWAANSHGESSYLGKRLQQAALERGLNLILDGVNNGSAASVISKVTKARSFGYGVEANYIYTDPNSGVSRAKIRADRSGRRVPLNIIVGAYIKLPAIFDEIKSDVFDKVRLFDNNRDGEPAYVIGEGEMGSDFTFTSPEAETVYQRYLDSADVARSLLPPMPNSGADRALERSMQDLSGPAR